MVVILFSETVTVPQSDDSKSGAREDLSVFRTSTAELKIGNTTFPHYFGQLATFGDPANMFRVHFTDSNDFRAVSGGEGTWEQFWTDKGSNDSNDYTVWKVLFAHRLKFYSVLFDGIFRHFRSKLLQFHTDSSACHHSSSSKPKAALLRLTHKCKEWFLSRTASVRW